MELNSDQINCNIVCKYVLCVFGLYNKYIYYNSVSPLQALSKNGKVYSNGIMIGVQPCIDKVRLSPRENIFMSYFFYVQ